MIKNRALFLPIDVKAIVNYVLVTMLTILILYQEGVMIEYTIQIKPCILCFRVLENLLCVWIDLRLDWIL